MFSNRIKQVALIQTEKELYRARLFERRYEKDNRLAIVLNIVTEDHLSYFSTWILNSYLTRTNPIDVWPTVLAKIYF